MYRRLLFLTLATTPLLLLGLEPTQGLHYSYPMQAGSRLTVDNRNGSVEITGWDQNTIDITATKYAETQQLLEQVKVDVAVAADGVHIRTIAPSESGQIGVKYVIKAPRGIELAEIRTSNGPIRVNEVEGGANLHTSNGPVDVSKTRGRLEIRTSNGPVHVQEIEGEADIQTSNGPVHASSLRGGPITLATSNGPVDLRLAAAERPVKATTSNGPITLRMPASAGVRLKAETSSHNRVSSDFDIRKEGDNSPSRLEGVVGTGGPTLDLKTSQGPIRLLKL